MNAIHSGRVPARGHYKRDLQTKAGTVRLKMPKLRHVPFETAIIWDSFDLTGHFPSKERNSVLTYDSILRIRISLNSKASLP